MASRAGNTEALERLLKVGYAADAKEQSGLTALSFASSSGDGQSVRLLLSAGADCTVSDSFGKQPQ